MKPAWVFTENIVHTTIGHEAYGTYSSLFAIVLIFSVLADWGISNYAVHVVAGDKTRYASVFSSFFIIRVVITLFFPALMYGVGWLLGYEKDELLLLAIVALTQTFVYFLAFFRAKLQAFQAFKTDGFMSVLERIILIGMVIILLQTVFDLQLFVEVRFVAMLVAVLIGLIVVIKKYGRVKLRLSKKEVAESLKAALPFTIMTLLYAFNERVDMVMVERMHSKYEAGLYAGAYRWYDALMMFVWLTQPIFFSKFSMAKGENSGASSLFNQGFLIVSIPMLFITPFLFFDGDILFFLFDQTKEIDIMKMNGLFKLLMISFIFNAFFVIKGTYLNASGYVKKVNWIILLSALLNAVLNYIFIPEYGAFAAGITTAISTGCLGLGYFVMVMLSRLRVDLKNLLGVFIAFTVSFGIYYYLKINIDNIGVCLIGSSGGFILILMLFGITGKIKNNLG